MVLLHKHLLFLVSAVSGYYGFRKGLFDEFDEEVEGSIDGQ